MILLVAALAIALVCLYVFICRRNFRRLRATPLANPVDPSQLSSKRVVVVGAGASGLSAAKAFLQYGYQNVTVVEASDEMGGVWRSSQYDGAAIQGPYWLYQFPDFAWPRELVRDTVSPGKRSVQEYLRQYCKRFGLLEKANWRYGCFVKRAARDEKRNVWIIDVERPQQEERLEADILIMAVGNNSTNPIIPTLPGRESYSGTVLHSSQVGDGSALKTANNICIVGGSKSAYDIGQFHPDKTTMILRTPHYWTPRWIVCVPFFDRLVYYMFRGYRLWPSERPWLVRFLDWFIATFVAVGRVKPHHRSVLDDIMVGGGFHICTTSGAYANSKRWNIETSPPRAYTERGLVLENGKEVETDVIVWGTGFRPTRFFERVFEGIALQENLDDGLYLHKYICHPSLPDCYFIGFRDPSLNVPSTASVQSLWAVLCAAGVVALPKPQEMREMLERRMNATRQTFPHSHRRAFYDYFLRPPCNCDYSYAQDLLRDCELLQCRSPTLWRHPVDIWSCTSDFGAILGAEVALHTATEETGLV